MYVPNVAPNKITMIRATRTVLTPLRPSIPIPVQLNTQGDYIVPKN